MNESHLLRQLGMRMAVEPEPQVDVVSRVIKQIAQSSTRVVEPWLSLVSVSACALTATVLLVTWATFPEKHIFSPLSKAVSNSTGPESLRRVLEP